MIKQSFSLYSSTVQRDISLLLNRRGFWWFLAIWAAVTSIVFFTYLDNFLAIQPTLRAKNFRYGVTDIVIMPYLSSSAIVATVFINALCCRLFYHEHFSPFSLTQRSLQPPAITVVAAKWTYVAILSFVAIIIIVLPLIACALLFNFDGLRVVIMTIALFMLLLLVGGVTMLLSQYFTHSIMTALFALSLVVLTMVVASMVSQPSWLSDIFVFISPLTHTQRIATGVVTLSDVIFFVMAIMIISKLSLRQFTNTYLSI